MTQNFHQGPHGYVLHDACWCLLQKAFEPASVSLPRLLEVCESLPFPLQTNTTSWGHDFGGLWQIENVKAFPWEEGFFVERSPSPLFWDGLEDPLDVPDIPVMLSSKVELPSDKSLVKSPSDCFATLPWELLDLIGTLLVTEDALSLRGASASFLPLLTSERFWASRFAADGERGFLFELRKPRGYVDWLKLYKLSSPSHYSAGLRNRRRIWYLTREIADIAQLSRTVTLPDAEAEICSQNTWTRILCDLHSYSKDGRWWAFFNGGCRLFGTCTIVLPDDLLRVCITTINVGLRTYVTGLRFVSGSQPDQRVGYVTEQNERTFETSSLLGLRLAVSRSGIRALQLIGKKDCFFQWAGDPTGMPVSNALIKSEPISRLAVSYDVSWSICS